MKYVFQFARILAFSFAGELLHWLLPLPIPSSIYGLILLLLALMAGVVRLDQVKETGNFLTGLFTLLFIPGTVGLMELWSVLAQIWLPIVIALIPVTILVFAVSGHVTQGVAEHLLHLHLPRHRRTAHGTVKLAGTNLTAHRFHVSAHSKEARHD